MSSTQVVQLVDDLTGEVGPGVRTVQFAVDGVDYEIELTESHAVDLTEALRRYVEKGRRVTRARAGRSRRR